MYIDPRKPVVSTGTCDEPNRPRGLPEAAALPRRPLAYLAGAYISGIAFCYLFAPPLVPLVAMLAALAAALFCHIPAHKYSYKLFAILLCIAFLAGAVYSHTAFSKADPLEQLMADSEGYAEDVVGRVLFVEERDIDYRVLTLWSRGRKLLVRVYGYDGVQLTPAPEELIGKRVSVSGPVTFPDVARNPGGFNYRLHLLSKNTRVVLTCELPDDLVLLNGQASLEKPDDIGWEVLGVLARAKASFAARVKEMLPSEEAGLLMGMVFGSKEDLDEDMYDLFKRHGVAHILSVSGLHVGLVYAFVAAALGRRKTKGFYIAALILLLCYAALSNFSPSVMRAFSMIVVHIAANLLNRRYDMLTGVLLAALITLLVNPLALFGVGFILSYTAACSLAFALPFAARRTEFRNLNSGRKIKAKDYRVIYKMSEAKFAGGRVMKVVVPAAIIQFFMLPLTMYYFNCLPVLGVLVNIPVIALASLIVPFGIVVLLLSAAAAFLPGLAVVCDVAAGVGTLSAGFMIDVMLFFTKLADAVPFSSFTVPSPPLPLIFAFYFAMFFLMSDTFAIWVSSLSADRSADHAASHSTAAPATQAADYSSGSAHARCRGLVLPVLIVVTCLFVSMTPMGRYSDAAFTFVDVGQGDCLHIRTEDGRNYLMDGGGKLDYNVGKNILAPYLLKNGVSRLDGIFVSHLHMDHFKGLTELAAQIDVGPVYVYEGYGACPEAVTNAFQSDADGSAIAGSEPAGSVYIEIKDIRYLAAGDIVLLGDYARAEVLFPQRVGPGPGGSSEPNDNLVSDEGVGAPVCNWDSGDENKTSLIIRFVNSGISVLMTGDVNKDGEAAMMDIADPACDILKIGHHGSRTSTSEELLVASGAAAAVIQVGKNSFGHPTPEVLEALACAGIPVYRNDESGAILIRPAKSGFAAAGSTDRGFAVQTTKRDLVSPVLRKPHEK